jgi:phospho-N-acetylmuramoyl-pentapeptide-transferase
MFYYLALKLLPWVSVLNVLTYHTVRAGAAVFTAFGFSLLMGPWMIRLLLSLKAGQYIKKDHVAELHKLHKGKAGTPTMGGALIIFSTLFTLLLWGRLENRLLWIAMAGFVMLGIVGFIDDFIKLKRKHNDGLSARAKFTGQILTGLMLGVYLVNNPVTVSAARLDMRDITSWPALAGHLRVAGKDNGASAAARIRARMPQAAAAALETDPLSSEARRRIVSGLNEALESEDLYLAQLWPEVVMNEEAARLIQRENSEGLAERGRIRLNRLLLEAAFPEAIAQSTPNLHTKLGVPGLKETMIPLGPVLYVFFVILLITGVSNAVNLTDGLDGLAAGAGVISILTYAGIAYIISRADWSRYLFLIYVPEASELFVFGAALLGAGLGFLWYNSHPAEVFMGDTGSMALGGAIATLAILTKQELLLPLVAGLFMLEAVSVLLQVGSFKLTGKRIFRMAPLHHHFELGGWSETKVTLRFWIIALLLALMSLGTLKLR